LINVTHAFALKAEKEEALAKRKNAGRCKEEEEEKEEEEAEEEDTRDCSSKICTGMACLQIRAG
jgi:hypothetical protein